MRYILNWKRSLRLENKASVRLNGMLGFAMRAGKVIIGTDLVCSALSKKSSVSLVLLSESASDQTKKKIRNKCEFYQKPLRHIRIDGEELGRLLGKDFTPMVVGICDVNFANEINKALDLQDVQEKNQTERKEVSHEGNR